MNGRPRSSKSFPPAQVLNRLVGQEDRHFIFYRRLTVDGCPARVRTLLSAIILFFFFQFSIISASSLCISSFFVPGSLIRYFLIGILLFISINEFLTSAEISFNKKRKDDWLFFSFAWLTKWIFFKQRRSDFCSFTFDWKILIIHTHAYHVSIMLTMPGLTCPLVPTF